MGAAVILWAIYLGALVAAFMIGCVNGYIIGTRSRSIRDDDPWADL